MPILRWIVPPLAALFLLFGCAEEDPTAPPSGWEATETRMWAEGVDTAAAFRNLDDLVAMGVLDEKLTLDQGGLSQQQFQNAIKQTILELYRNNPPMVDSLFNAYAVSELEGADLSGAVDEGGTLAPKVQGEYQKAAYEAITDHFREPQMEEKASSITYPDSLRTEEASGTVDLQARVDTSGAIDAVEVIQGTHPTLDAIAMRAAVMSSVWEPAYLLQDDEWRPVRSWVRFSIPFPAPQN